MLWVRVASLEKELMVVFQSKIKCEGSTEREDTVKAVLQKLRMISQEQLTDIQHVKVRLINVCLSVCLCVCLSVCLSNFIY